MCMEQSELLELSQWNVTRNMTPMLMTFNGHAD